MQVCHERWLFLIMLCAEVGAAVAARRQGLARAAALLQRGNDLRLRGQLTWFASSLLLN